MKRLAALLTCALALSPGWAHAVPSRERSKASFTAPASEHRISSGVDKGDLERVDQRSQRAATQPSSEVEARHYFRERPDALFNAAKLKEQKLLDELLRDREAQVKARRSEAIKLLESFVRSEPEQAAEMADALLRLSELTWELSRIEYLQAFAAWQNVPEHNRSAEPPVPAYDRTIALYDRILNQHADFERLDLVLYMKAFTLVERGDNDGSLVLFRRILHDFPASRFRPDAHMALAEHVFNTDYDFRAALLEYDQVLRYPESELYDLALFKSAWCLWQLGQKTEAAVRFRKVLDIDGELAQTGRRKRLKELQSEALEYLIQVFTEDERNRAADVRRFLQEIGGERHVERVLVRLSATYYDQARFDQGIEAYALLLQINPSDKRAPQYQLAIARGFIALDQFDKALTAYGTLANDYKKSGTWASQQGDPELASETDATVEKALREQALALHELGQRDDKKQHFERSVAFYKLYLTHFDDRSESYRLTFYLGEVLFHRLGRYGEAGDAYLKAAQKSPQGEFTKDALYNAIGAFERVREKEVGVCTQDVKAPCAETENDKKFSQAIELYAAYYPDDPDLPEILFRQGKLYYERRIFDPAVRMFGQLLDRYPQSPYAADAGELVLDSFNRAADYENIERWARKLKTAPAFKSPESQKRLNGLILGAVFNIGEQLAKKGAHAEAAAAYVRAASEFPADPRAPKAYFNAGVELQRAGKLSEADQAYSALIAKYPGSNEGALAAWNGAEMYESIALFRDAARFYEAYAERFAKAEKASDAGYNAVLLRLSARDYDQAVQDGNRYLNKFAKEAAADDVYFLIGRAYEAQGKKQDAARTYREYLKRSKNVDRRIEAHTRLGQVELSANDRKGADVAFGNAVSEARKLQKKLTSGRYYAAEARYLQGDEALRDFEAVKIEGDVRGLSARLKQKSKLLGKAALIYADVVDFQVAEWVTAALYKIGQTYELFAKGLNDAPVPPGLNEEEQQVYRDELAMFVVPIEERALEAYEGGYKKARELFIYNKWTVLMREGLTRMNEVQYPPLRERGGDIAQVNAVSQGPILKGLRPRTHTPAVPVAQAKPAESK